MPSNTGPNSPPLPTKPSSSGSGSAVAIAVVLASLFVVFTCGGILAAFFLPAVTAARESARRMQCGNNLKQIALALHNYELAYGSLPPAYTVDAAGNRLHSWRTLILPWLEQSPLYQSIDFSKPWDDPVNSILRERAVPCYRCPTSKIAVDMTTYQIIDDPASAFPGSTSLKFNQISDGLSHTVFVVETDDQDAVHWAEPKDQSLLSYLSATKSSHYRGRNAAMGDGAVKFLSNNVSQQVSQDIATIAGGEAVNLNGL